METSINRFNGKTAIISGAASGMGFLCARCLAAEGASVVLTDVNEAAVLKAAKSIDETGNRALGFAVDVRDYQQVNAACEKAVARFGGIDILINCAGGSSARVFGCNKPYYEYPIDYLDWGIDVNLKGALYFSHAVMGVMAKREKGVIILMGSITGEEGSPKCVDYAAAKSALMNGVLKSLAQNGAKIGVRVNTVSPGPVLTRPQMANMRTMLGRAAEPQEIVDLILYLCSDKAAFITGSNYMIDGGRACLPVE